MAATSVDGDGGAGHTCYRKRPNSRYEHVPTSCYLDVLVAATVILVEHAALRRSVEAVSRKRSQERTAICIP